MFELSVFFVFGQGSPFERTTVSQLLRFQAMPSANLKPNLVSHPVFHSYLFFGVRYVLLSGLFKGPGVLGFLGS